MIAVRAYWAWLGRRLRLSSFGRILFTVAIVCAVAAFSIARAQGAREGGAPLVVLVLLLAGVIALDALGRGVVALGRRSRR